MDLYRYISPSKQQGNIVQLCTMTSLSLRDHPSTHLMRRLHHPPSYNLTAVFLRSPDYSVCQGTIHPTTLSRNATVHYGWIIFPLVGPTFWKIIREEKTNNFQDDESDIPTTQAGCTADDVSNKWSKKTRTLL